MPTILRRREDEIRMELRLEGLKLISQWGSLGEPAWKRYQVITDGPVHHLIAGDSIYGWDLDRIEAWTFPDMARCPRIEEE